MSFEFSDVKDENERVLVSFMDEFVFDLEFFIEKVLFFLCSLFFIGFEFVYESFLSVDDKVFGRGVESFFEEKSGK